MDIDLYEFIQIIIVVQHEHGKVFCSQVDKHIRKLDADLARFEADLKEQHAKEAGYSDFESKLEK